MTDIGRPLGEQLAGLELVKRAVEGSTLSWQMGDVAAVRLGKREICYASGGYDLWVGGHLKRPDLTLEQAIEALREKSA